MMFPTPDYVLIVSTRSCQIGVFCILSKGLFLKEIDHDVLNFRHVLLNVVACHNSTVFPSLITSDQPESYHQHCHFGSGATVAVPLLSFPDPASCTRREDPPHNALHCVLFRCRAASRPQTEPDWQC